MPFDLKSRSAIFKPNNLLSFIEHLRRHKQQTIIDSGTFLCWESFKNPEFRDKNSDQLHIVNAYAPKHNSLSFSHRKITIEN